MVAAVDAVHEGDAVARMVGEPETEDARIEVDRAHDVGGEHEHVRETAGWCV